ncbi:MAG: hypothetical protein ACTHJM_01570, partial [Marmoricola sp.]
VVLATGVVAPAEAFNPTPEPPSTIVRLAGAHWQAGAGLPVGTSQSDVGLVQLGPTAPDTHVRVGYVQHVPASLTELGFTAQTPGGINPCWKVRVTTSDGTTFTLHLTTDSAQGVSEVPPGGDFSPIVQWTWTLNLPAGDRVTSATAEVMTDSAPSAGGQVTFDDFTVNGSQLRTP